jgi:hypothetical protein
VRSSSVRLTHSSVPASEGRRLSFRLDQVVASLPELQAQDVLDPLRAAMSSIGRRLEARMGAFSSDQNSTWALVFGMVLSSNDTMKAALFLVADRRLAEKADGTGPGPFPAQAVMLQRGQLEALGNLMALLEHPSTRDSLYRRDAYRDQLRLLQAMRAKHAGAPAWDQWIAHAEQSLARQARHLRLSEGYGRPWLTGTRKAAFQLLYDDSYSLDSRIAHHKHPALDLAVRRHRGLSRVELEGLRNASVFRSAILHSAVLTEAEAAMTWSPSSAMSELRQVWPILVRGFDSAADIHAVRYAALLHA